MPKISSRKLKVFQAQFGFFDTVLAVSSQAEALRVWGTHRNLFATGNAKLATDEAAVAAALEHPGILLRRAIGSDEPFALHPTGLPKIPDLPNEPRATGRRAEAKPKPAPKPPADRSKLDAAEAALRELDEARKREEADFGRAQEELDQRRTAAQQNYVEARKAAISAVVAAREAYRQAGGQD